MNTRSDFHGKSIQRRAAHWPQATNQHAGRHASALDAVRAQADRHGTANPDELRRCVALAKAGDTAALEKVIGACLRVVIREARRYRSSRHALEDLIAEGRIGVRDAIVAYDPRLSACFMAYVVTVVRRRMYEWLRGNCRPVRVPAQASRLSRAANAARERMIAEGVAHPGEDDLSRATGVSVRRIRSIASLGQKALELDSPVGDGDMSVGDGLADANAVPASEQLLSKEQIEMAGQALTCLSSRSRRIIEMRFGLGGGQPRRYRDIGAVLGMSKERVRQLVEEAVVRMRRWVAAANGVQRGETHRQNGEL